MRLTDSQWEYIEPFIPKPKSRIDGKGRPWRDSREVLEGILWVLKTGARWRDMPADYPPYQTCHRRFQAWAQEGVIHEILRKLIEHLRRTGKIDLTETCIDATYVDVKKGFQSLGRRSAAKGPRSWQSQIVHLCRSPLVLRVLHHMRLDSLIKQFGPGILASYLSDLSETKLTILTACEGTFDADIESNLLLPVSAIANVQDLRMDELYADTLVDGELSDISLG